MVFDSEEQRGEWRALTAIADSRRLRLALAASIVIHLLLVLQKGRPSEPVAAVPNLLATLHPSAAAVASVPGAPPPVARRPAAVSPAPSFLAPKDVPTTSSALAAAPAMKPVEQAPASTAAVSPSAESASEGAAADVAGGLSADGLRRYRLSLASQARRFKRYPARALASGWTGTVEIRLDIGDDGQPSAVRVLRSSGYAVLDRAALSMIEEGARHVPMPAELRGRVFSVVLPVIFDLAEG